MAKKKNKDEVLTDAKASLENVFATKKPSAKKSSAKSPAEGKRQRKAKSPKRILPPPPPPPPAVIIAATYDQEMQIGAATPRRTEEGWPLYTEEELKLGQGKNTPLCPFECDCCF